MLHVGCVRGVVVWFHFRFSFTMSSSAPPSLSVFHVFWLLHVIVEMPVALLAFFKPQDFPLAGLNDTTVLIMRVRTVHY